MEFLGARGIEKYILVEIVGLMKHLFLLSEFKL